MNSCQSFLFCPVQYGMVGICQSNRQPGCQLLKINWSSLLTACIIWWARVHKELLGHNFSQAPPLRCPRAFHSPPAAPVFGVSSSPPTPLPPSPPLLPFSPSFVFHFLLPLPFFFTHRSPNRLVPRCIQLQHIICPYADTQNCTRWFLLHKSQD